MYIYLSLFAPFLNACANHLDKYLIAKYIEDGKVGALIIFSAIFGIFALPFIYFYNPSVLAVTAAQAFWLTANGSLIVLAILCYFYALQQDEASKVVPYYQAIPVFSFILAYFILGETITLLQLAGAGVIFLGTVILSTEKGEDNRYSYKKGVAGLMFLAAFFYAINSVIFKLIALEEGFWVSIFWGILGKVLIGLIFFAFISSYRKEFFALISNNRLFVLTYNSVNEAITLLAEAIAAYFTLLFPVAIIAVLMDSFQPVFVFVLGVLLTLFFPRISEEGITRRDLLQKGFAILVIVIGGYIISI